MKTRFTILLLISIMVSGNICAQKQPIIIDHNCCDISKVPSNFINTAKSQLRIAYGHTSHGSQIITGMDILKILPNSIYTYNKGQGSLFINDASLLPGDLGAPDRVTWATETREVLNSNTLNINLIMWSWCGQVDAREIDITNYLNLMSQLEIDFPNVKFVYMTGHLVGTGVNGNVNLRNEQIRKYCKNNGKILFDFADIESYDPDGKYFLDKGADDGCNYQGGNWAVEWCIKNPSLCNTSCSCAHSNCLNCQQKGKAFWWMIARIAGWDGLSTDVINDNFDKNNFYEIFPNPTCDKININTNNNNLDNVKYVDISIYNALGVEIIALSKIDIENTINFSTEEFPSGVYYCTMNTGTSKITKSFVVIR